MTRIYADKSLSCLYLRSFAANSASSRLEPLPLDAVLADEAPEELGRDARERRGLCHVAARALERRFQVRQLEAIRGPSSGLLKRREGQPRLGRSRRHDGEPAP